MMRFLGISLFVLLASTSLFARTPQEAANIASQFISQSHTAALPRMQRAAAATSLAAPVDLVYTHYQQDQTTPAVYVFNSLGDEGFVLVSAEDNARAILGYSDHGVFDQTDIPENMQFWLSMYANELSRVASQPTAPKQVGGAINAPLPNIEPLLGDVVWGQDKPFNNLCPTVNGGKSVTGCVATALAQIMYAHKYPTKGIGSITYKMENGMEISEDFSQTTYDWENMIPNYNAQYTEQEATAVAALMYHVGVASRMDYSPSASSSISSWALLGLNRYFNYDADVQVAIKDYMLEPDILTAIAEDLQAGRPVYIGGRTTKNEGHAFVCDGMRSDGYVHINWGWRGTGNGFYAISALDPGQQGIGGSSSNLAFTELVTFYTHIRPNQGGTATPVVYAQATRESAAQIARKNQVKFKLENIGNAGLTGSSGDYGYFIYDSQNNLVDEVIIHNDLWFATGYMYSYIDLSARIPNNLKPGKYYLVIGYRDHREGVTPVLIHTQGYPKYPFTLTADSVLFGSNDLQMPTTLQADWIHQAGTTQWQLDLYSPDFWNNNIASDQWLVRCTLNSNSATSVIGSYILDKKNSKTSNTINLTGAVCAIGHVADCKQYTPNQLQLTITQDADTSLLLHFLIEFNGQTFEGSTTLSQTKWYQLSNGEYLDYSTHVTYEPATALTTDQAISMTYSWIPCLVEGYIVDIATTPADIVAKQSADFSISDDGDNSSTLSCRKIQWLNKSEWTTGEEIHAGDKVIVLGTLSEDLRGSIYQHTPTTYMPITAIEFSAVGMQMTSTWESQAPYYRVRLYDKEGKVVANNIINKKTITAKMPAEGEYTFYIRPMLEDKKQYAGEAKVISFVARTSTDTEIIDTPAHYDVYDVMGNRISHVIGEDYRELPHGIYILVGENTKKIYIP